jgi:hypothetical protein
MDFDPVNELIETARAQGLWLHCAYQDLWFSPDELSSCRRAGRFRWSAENFTLRDPKAKLADLLRKEAEAMEAVMAFKTRLKSASPCESAQVKAE